MTPQCPCCNEPGQAERDSAIVPACECVGDICNDCGACTVHHEPRFANFCEARQRVPEDDE